MYQDGSFKSINEKVYKILVKQNDDNRELAETTDISEEVDRIQSAVQTIEGFCLDFINKFNASIILFDIKKVEYLQVGKFITAINAGINLIEKLDVNSATKTSIDSLQTMLDTIQNYANDIERRKPEWFEAYTEWVSEDPDRDPEDMGIIFNIRVAERSIDQLLKTLTKLTGLLNVKLLNYKQNQQNISREQGVPIDDDDTVSTRDSTISGSGSGYKFSLFNTAPYQPVQKLMV
jgi:hypothetical protein